jgi:hypothetical protein
MSGGAREQNSGDPSRGHPTLAAAARPLFLHRDTYRRRRIMDAARLLPLFGTALMLLPMLWADDHSTGYGAVYLFLAWAGLIATAALLARKLSEPLRRPGAPPSEEAEE